MRRRTPETCPSPGPCLCPWGGAQARPQAETWVCLPVGSPLAAGTAGLQCTVGWWAKARVLATPPPVVETCLWDCSDTGWTESASHLHVTLSPEPESLTNGQLANSRGTMVPLTPGLKRCAPPRPAGAVQRGLWREGKRQRTMNHFPAAMERNATPLLRYVMYAARHWSDTAK